MSRREGDIYQALHPQRVHISYKVYRWYFQYPAYHKECGGERV